MIVLTLEGVAPWDGRYELADFGFTNRELFEIKKLSGIRAGELIEALDANDTAAFVGVAVVVLARHGKTIDPDDLWNAAVGSIVLDIVADDADPPTVAATPSSESETGSPAERSGDSGTAGGG